MAALLTSTWRPSNAEAAASTAAWQTEASRRSPAKAQGPAALRLDLLHERVQLAGGTCDDSHARALAREGPGDGSADTPAGAGDESGSAADLHPAEQYRRRASSWASLKRAGAGYSRRIGGKVPTGMDYKDYYKTLGVSQDREREGNQGRLSQARPQAPPRHEPGERQGGSTLQGDQRSLRGALRSREAAQYDQLGADWETYARQPGAGAGAWPGGGGVRVEFDFGGAGPGGFSDFFRRSSAGGPASRRLRRPRRARTRTSSLRRHPRRRADVEHPVELTLEEVLKGATRTLALGEAREGPTGGGEDPRGRPRRPARARGRRRRRGAGGAARGPLPPGADQGRSRLSSGRATTSRRPCACP